MNFLHKKIVESAPGDFHAEGKAMIYENFCKEHSEECTHECNAPCFQKVNQ